LRGGELVGEVDCQGSTRQQSGDGNDNRGAPGCQALPRTGSEKMLIGRTIDAAIHCRCKLSNVCREMHRQPSLCNPHGGRHSTTPSQQRTTAKSHAAGAASACLFCVPSCLLCGYGAATLALAHPRFLLSAPLSNADRVSPVPSASSHAASEPSRCDRSQ
jgi:hypothetical protein